jgi:hypothetical protein
MGETGRAVRQLVWCRRCDRIWDARQIGVIFVDTRRVECCPDWQCDGMGTNDLRPDNGLRDVPARQAAA